MPLMIGLADVDLDAKLRRAIAKTRGDIVERLGAVDFRLASSEAVEVRSVQDEDRRHVCLRVSPFLSALAIMSDNGILEFTVNGEPHRQVAGSIADLVRSLGLDPSKVAVERNR